MRICLDVDGVLADPGSAEDYANRLPYPFAADMVRRLKAAGHEIICQTARYMGRFDGDQSKAHHQGWQELVDWLTRHDIPFDEVYLGKANCNIFVDDRACRVESAKGPQAWNALFDLIEKTH